MRTVRHHLSSLAVLLATACAVAVPLAGPAAAGGPTSVLLASPYTDSAAALYYADNDYAELQRLLGGPDLPTGTTGEPPASVAGAPYVTATWLIHDVSVWRIDRIFLHDGDLWIVTETSSGEGTLTGDGMYPGEPGDSSAVWHLPADPAALTGLLAARDLVPATSDAGGRSTASAELLAAPTSQPAPVPAAGGWWWAIGGLVVGFAAGGAVVRLVARRGAPVAPTRSPAEPAQMYPTS